MSRSDCIVAHCSLFLTLLTSLLSKWLALDIGIWRLFNGPTLHFRFSLKLTVGSFHSTIFRHPAHLFSLSIALLIPWLLARPLNYNPLWLLFLLLPMQLANPLPRSRHLQLEWDHLLRVKILARHKIWFQFLLDRPQIWMCRQSNKRQLHKHLATRWKARQTEPLKL